MCTLCVKIYFQLAPVSIFSFSSRFLCVLVLWVHALTFAKVAVCPENSGIQG